MSVKKQPVQMLGLQKAVGGRQTERLNNVLQVMDEIYSDPLGL